jgi:hypothetical protein
MFRVDIKAKHYQKHIGEGSDAEFVKQLLKDAIEIMIDHLHEGDIEVTTEDGKCIYRISIPNATCIQHWLGG